MKTQTVSLEALASFDEIIDVRTPLEFADDHVPGAINAPVMSNEERVIIGTLYDRAPFEATRLGAAMVARNIAHHLETIFADRPRNWRPLVYCWRGGKRSESMVAWFNLIGWQARRLDGGYRTYRRHVLDALERLPVPLSYIVLTGHTGSGKTRLLHALGEAGAQVLDLEGLARHRGSLLGAWPDASQPTQKGFESALVSELSKFDTARPVFIEAESRRIGRLSLPAALLDAFHAGRCVRVQVPMDARVAFLLEDYKHLFDAPQSFKDQLTRLIGLHSRQTVTHWHALIDADERAQLFTELVDRHYDPAYARSSDRSFGQMHEALPFGFDPCAADLVGQARDLLTLLDDAQRASAAQAHAAAARPADGLAAALPIRPASHADAG